MDIARQDSVQRSQQMVMMLSWEQLEQRGGEVCNQHYFVQGTGGVPVLHILRDTE